MSDPHPENVLAERPSTRNLTLTVLAAVGGMLIFLLILFVAYLPQRETDPLATTKEQRFAILAETRAKTAGRMDTFEVIDPQKGIYKLPVEAAMEATVRAYQNKQKPQP